MRVCVCVCVCVCVRVWLTVIGLRLSVQVGEEFLVDATLEEESCCSAQLLFSVDPAGRICATMKGKLRGIPRDSLSEGIAVSLSPHHSVCCGTAHVDGIRVVVLHVQCVAPIGHVTVKVM